MAIATKPADRRAIDELARCKDEDISIFFPLRDDDEAEEAKAICGLCQVQGACLERALLTGEKEGVWGGMTARERRRLIRRRRRTAA